MTCSNFGAVAFTMRYNRHVERSGAQVKKAKAANIPMLQEQLAAERRLVSFDNYDITVRQLLEMRKSGAVHIPPEYQRQFVWDEARESVLIESVFLGIPIPSLFMATNEDATWEVVDGVQRLGTLSHYVGEQVLLDAVKKESPLRTVGLGKLEALNDTQFSDLPPTIQLMFETRPIRITVLNDKSDLDVRFDLFERLNTGGISLTNQEIRNCVFRGKFNDQLKKLSVTVPFKSVIRLKASDQGNGTAEEFVLRFFAFLENYENFDRSVKDFLNGYMKLHAKKQIKAASLKLFNETFKILSNALPNGIVRGTNVTPVNLYEAIAVGTALAIDAGKKPTAGKLKLLLENQELRGFTTAGTNNPGMVTGRINFVRDAL